MRFVERLAGAFFVHVRPRAHVPGGTVHSYRNLTEAHFLTIVSKGNAAKFFAQAASEVKMSPPDIPALIRVASDHGITIAG